MKIVALFFALVIAPSLVVADSSEPGFWMITLERKVWWQEAGGGLYHKNLTWKAAVYSNDGSGVTFCTSLPCGIPSKQPTPEPSATGATAGEAVDNLIVKVER